MTRECHVRFREGGGVRFPSATRRLAKAINPTPEGDRDLSQTLTAAVTQVGVIMGTAAYMSPEQARGQPVDKRSDIWAFGCVLYEMLTGAAAFAGATVTDLLAAIVSTEPDRSTLPDGLPWATRLLLDRCLQKAPRQRLRDIGEVRIAIDTPGPREVIGGGRSRRETLAWGVAAVLGVALVAAVWQPGRPSPQSTRPVARFSLDLADDSVLSYPPGVAIAVSPDGEYVAYSAAIGSALVSTPRLYVRALGGFDTQPVAGTEGAIGPFFSPDSRWIGFFNGDALYKVSVDGGTPVKLGEHQMTTFGGATWGPDDEIVFAADAGLYRVSADGGQPAALPITTDPGDLQPAFPQFLPDGDTLLLSLAQRSNSSVSGAEGAGDRAGLLSLRTGTVQMLEDLGPVVTARYASSGHLMYGRRAGSAQLAGTLMAVPFDLASLRVTGSPTAILEGVYTSRQSAYAVSTAGSLVYVEASLLSAGMTLTRVERGGGRTALSSHVDRYHYPRFSPAGDHLAVAIHDTDNRHRIWLFDIARDTRRPLTFDGDDNNPLWTPDGRHVAFGRRVSGDDWDIYWQPVDGSTGAEPLLAGPFADVPRSWTSDGRLLAFERTDPTTGRDIWVLPVDGEPSAVLAEIFNERAPALSPDGKRLAYVSNESGQDEVYVRTYPELANQKVVSSGGGREPLWSRDGRVLFYRSAAADLLFAMPFEEGDTLTPTTRETVVIGQYDTYLAGGPSYDASLDGTSYVMLAAGDATASSGGEVRELRFVLNWMDALQGGPTPD